MCCLTGMCTSLVCDIVFLWDDLDLRISEIKRTNESLYRLDSLIYFDVP